MLRMSENLPGMDIQECVLGASAGWTHCRHQPLSGSKGCGELVEASVSQDEAAHHSQITLDGSLAEVLQEIPLPLANSKVEDT